MLLMSLVVSKDELLGVLRDGEEVEIKVKFSKPIFKKYYNQLEISDGSRTKKYKFKKDLKLNIWKLDIGDTDGDGIDELALGVYTRAPHHSVFAKRVFLYNIEDLELKAKFRASRLVSPMEDFLLYDIDGNGIDNIVSIEKYKDEYKVRAYIQYDLLIEKLYESSNYKDLSRLHKSNSLYLESNNETYEVYLEKEELKLR